jgi:transposase-like protein
MWNSPQNRRQALLDRIPQEFLGLQANFCRTPSCVNFGRPTDEVVHASGTGYYLSGAVAAPRIGCSACNRHAKILSNEALVLEIDRLVGRNGASPSASCPVRDCPNHQRPPDDHPEGYYRHGRTAAGRQRFRCRLCGSTCTPAGGGRAQLRSEINPTLLRLAVNGVSIRGMSRILGVPMRTVYRHLEFLQRRLLAFEAAKLLKLRTVAKHERRHLALCTDAQDQMVNWWSRDRRPVQTTCICTAENMSGYIFRADVNFDPGTGPASRHFEQLVRSGELKGPGGLGRSARYEMRAFLEAAIWGLQRELAASPTPERALELDRLIAAARLLLPGALPGPKVQGNPPEGVMVSRFYTAAAHFAALDALLPPDAYLHVTTDFDKSLHGGALVGLAERLRRERVDLTLVRFEKGLSVPKREARIAGFRKAFAAFVAGLDTPMTDQTLLRRAFIRAHAQPQPAVPSFHADVWSVPTESMYEPGKMVGIAFQRPDSDPERRARSRLRLLDRSSLHAVDTFFNFTRQRVWYLDRPGDSRSSGTRHNRTQPYQAAMLQMIVDIARVWYNWCEPHPFRVARARQSCQEEVPATFPQPQEGTQHGGDKTSRPARDKSTPAMRLGLTNAPTRIDTILYQDWENEKHLSRHGWLDVDAVRRERARTNPVPSPDLGAGSVEDEAWPFNPDEDDDDRDGEPAPAEDASPALGCSPVHGRARPARGGRRAPRQANALTLRRGPRTSPAVMPLRIPAVRAPPTSPKRLRVGMSRRRTTMRSPPDPAAISLPVGQAAG